MPFHNLHIDFDSFFHSYYKAVYFFAWKYIKDETITEDIVESAFIKIWEKREKFENEVKAKAYLYKCVYTGCLRFLENEGRKERVYKVYKVSNEAEESGHIENMIRAETLRLVYEAMEKLPGECRKVFVKLFVEGKSVAEAAEELKVAVSTVKNQKARGIRLLRMRLTGLLFIVCSLWFVFF